MRLEDRLRESFSRRAQQVHGRPDEAWSAIQQRLGHRRASPGVRRLVVATVALAVAAAGGVVVVRAFLGSERRPAAERPEAPAPPEVDPRLGAVVQVGDFPQDIAVAGNTVWAIVQDEDPLRITLVAIEPANNQVVRQLPFPGGSESFPGRMLGTPEALWVSTVKEDQSGFLFELLRLDPVGGEITARLEGLSEPLAYGDGAVWAVARDARRDSVSVVRVDPVSADVTSSIPVQGAVSYLAAGEGAAWAVMQEVERSTVIGNQLFRADPQTRRAEPVEVPIADILTLPTVGGGFVWVPVYEDGTGNDGWEIVRLDPETGDAVGDPVPMTFPINSPIGVTPGAIWYIGDRPGGQVISRLNMHSLSFDASLKLGDATARPAVDLAAAVTVDGGTIWVANYKESITRVDLVPGSPGTADRR